MYGIKWTKDLPAWKSRNSPEVTMRYSQKQTNSWWKDRILSNKVRVLALKSLGGLLSSSSSCEWGEQERENNLPKTVFSIPGSPCIIFYVCTGLTCPNSVSQLIVPFLRFICPLSKGREVCTFLASKRHTRLYCLVVSASVVYAPISILCSSLSQCTQQINLQDRLEIHKD